MENPFRKCVLFSENCGIYLPRPNQNKILPFAKLKSDIKINCGKSFMNIKESELIQSRIEEKINDEQLICPKHRFEKGVCWKPSWTCQHPGHTERNKKKPVAVKSCPNKMAMNIAQNYPYHLFPIGSNICESCRNNTLAESSDDILEDDSDQDYVPDSEKKEKFNSAVNKFPSMRLALSPVKYQVSNKFLKIS
jgi:hypothetical protein